MRWTLIREHRGVEIDVDNLPLDDTKTFELLSTGETTGIFQLEGSGMRRYVKDLKPTEVRDLAAMVALFRPGPMANIPAYIRRKHGEEPVTYLHESLEPALRDTYGIFVYQEDIMTAAIAMADYTGPEADNLCYAIRKKKESVLREHEAKFKAGAKKKGIPPSVVDQVFAAFEPFARYGFNKAHATCYGLIAYQTAYLKANYPVEFMTAVLNGFRERAEKVAAVVAECRRLGIEVRPPDVQASARALHGRGRRRRHLRPSASAWPPSRTWARARSRRSWPPARAGPRPRTWPGRSPRSTTCAAGWTCTPSTSACSSR